MGGEQDTDRCTRKRIDRQYEKRSCENGAQRDISRRTYRFQANDGITRPRTGKISFRRFDVERYFLRAVPRSDHNNVLRRGREKTRRGAERQRPRERCKDHKQFRQKQHRHASRTNRIRDARKPACKL